MLGLLIKNVLKVWNFEGLEFVFVVFDFLLDVVVGEFVVLLGLLGCGKSMLFYIVVGLE